MTEKNMIDAVDEIDFATQKVMFLHDMFTAANAQDLELNGYALCGLCQIFRQILDHLETADAVIGDCRLATVD